MAREYRINRQINSGQVDLVLSDGSMRESVPFAEALSIAENENLDLVEVSADQKGKIPVCKILDYGRMRYHQSKKKKANKQVQHTKEIKYGFNISGHDLEVKHKKVFEFLSKNYIVRYILELKGRQKHMKEEALQKIKENLVTFVDIATWKEPRISGGSKKVEISTVIHVK